MNDGIVTTIFDRCKKCYSCIRECPAKAIQVVNGQAAVIADRCIVCGHCLKVCSQNAKHVKSDMSKVINNILPAGNAIAIIGPSFAASFPDNYNKLPSALRKLGFYQVVETAFGADLISDYYLKEYQKDDGKTLISSACPAVVNYIEKYFDKLVPLIAEIVSPMIALSRYLRETLSPQIKIVFIGPCIAKKNEYTDEEVADEIDAVLTFAELKSILKNNGIEIDDQEESNFDPPHAHMGKAFPLTGGLLKTADIPADILEKEIIVTEGKLKVIELIEEISNNNIHAKLVDVLFCEGCISGPAIDSRLNYYSRRQKVINYIEEKIHVTDKQVWKSNIYNSRSINFRRKFRSKNQRRPVPDNDTIREILASTNKFSIQDELNCGACGYATCREYAIAIGKGLAEKEMCLPFLLDKLGRAYDDLKNTQEQLRSAEKLASIGQLAAGVAHELNNPLGTIMFFASMVKKEIESSAGKLQQIEDLQLIVDESNRCKNIVSNLLNFARQSKLKITKINMCSLLSGIIRSIKSNPANSDIKIITGPKLNECIFEGDEDQLKQVFINLINNALESMNESSRPKIIKIKMHYEENYLITEISDTGCGIPREKFSKIFTPFYTTKKIGKGTGLGLAITYGIIKMHKGSISFQSELDKGSIFKVKLPKNLLSQNISNN